jgi:hypothetical protein
MDFEHWIQSRLTSHGFPVGPIDGVIGDKTTAAIKAFQSRNGILPSGKADEATIAALRSTSAGPVVRPIGEDQPAPTIKSVWPRQADVSAFYGAVGTSQTTIEIPFDMWLAWDKSVRARKMTLHTKVAASAERVLQAVAGLYSAQERKTIGLDLFGGSLNVRKMRGGSAYSMHSWGIAIDFDPERNQLKWGKDRARLAQPDAVPFWLEWEKEGWLSLGRARNIDWMHIQAARL